MDENDNQADAGQQVEEDPDQIQESKPEEDGVAEAGDDAEESSISDNDDKDGELAYNPYNSAFGRKIKPAEAEDEDLEKDELLQEMLKAGDMFPDDAYIDHEKFTCFFKRMVVNQNRGKYEFNMEASDQVRCLSESIDWQLDHVEKLKLHDKDIFVVLGASRTGKGTLLCALQGQQMGFFNRNKKNVKDTQIGQEAKKAKVLNFMAPVAANGQPLKSDIMSLGHNSHTMYPKIPFQCQYPSYYEEAGLKDTHLLDFPGMFESRGPELDVAVSLTLQKIFSDARSVKTLILVQASILEPTNAEILRQVKAKLKDMFLEPEKNLVIGITKCRMVEETFDKDELVDVALGANGENISFKGYEVLLVEQDDPHSIIDMLKKVSEKGCIKKFVRQGFLNPHDIEKMLSTVNPPGDMEVKKSIEWIQILNQSFVPKSSQISKVNMDDILKRIQKSIKNSMFSQQIRRDIMSNIRTLNLHQSHLSDGWKMLASPMEYKSILGLIPQYKYINRIMYNNRFCNPTLNAGFYQLDLLTIRCLKKIILVVQNEHLAQIKGWLSTLQSMVKQSHQKELLARCEQVGENIVHELEVMRVDEQEQKYILNFLEKESTTSVILGSAGEGVYNIVEALGSSESIFGDASSEQVRDFKNEVDGQFSKYINQALSAAQDALLVTTKREQRLKMIIEREKEMAEKSLTGDDKVEGNIMDLIDVEQMDSLISRFNLIKSGLNFKRVNSKRRNILAIDGGGVRVIIPLIILMALEEKTTRSVSSMFHMFGGTSLGAFVVSALNKPRSSVEAGYPKHNTLDVLQFFKDNLSKFFKPNPAVIDRKTGKPSASKAKLMGSSLYKNASLKQVLDSYFFEDKINDLVNQVSIPSFEENSAQTFWFENDVVEETADWPVSDVVQASMMAPGFFDSLVIGDSSCGFEFLDGGVAYNNPAKHMVANAVSRGADIENIFVLSLGTGKSRFQGRQSDQQLFWDEQRDGHSMTRQSEDTDDDLANLLPEGHYIRIQPELDVNIKFDATDEQSILYLQDVAFRALKINHDKIQEATAYFLKELIEQS